MPAIGRKPKPPGQAVNRHATLEFTEIENIRFKGGPKLQDRANGQPWPIYIVRKWRAWSTMPHCKFWNAEDWDFCFDSLEAAARMVESNFDPRRCAEVRNREKIMGTTFDFRRDLRIRYVEPRAETAKVVGLEDFQDL